MHYNIYKFVPRAPCCLLRVLGYALTLHVKLRNEEKKMKAAHDPINVHYTSARALTERRNDDKWKHFEKKAGTSYFLS